MFYRRFESNFVKHSYILLTNSLNYTFTFHLYKYTNSVYTVMDVYESLKVYRTVRTVTVGGIRDATARFRIRIITVTIAARVSSFFSFGNSPLAEYLKGLLLFRRSARGKSSWLMSA